MKLVAGLGNPGKKYDRTRHNVGFDVVSLLAGRFGTGTPRQRFQGETVEATMGEHRVLLLCPHTFMNLSGTSVLAARDFFKIANSDVLVVCDDFNLPFGRLRLRSKGSAGGQKGLNDIIRRLGDDQIPRLRIGIGPVPAGWDAANFVLKRFSLEEDELIQQTFKRAADAVESWVRTGIEPAMNQFNSNTMDGQD